MASNVPYFFIIGKAPFAQLHDLLLLQIFEFLNSGPFIVTYDKNTKLLAITIDTHHPPITKTLLYKQLHTPYFLTHTIGTKQKNIIVVDPHGKGIINDLIWYDLRLKRIIYHEYKTDARRKALITRWNTRERIYKRKQFLLLSQIVRENTIIPTINYQDYIKNTSFTKPILAKSCIRNHIL